MGFTSLRPLLSTEKGGDMEEEILEENEDDFDTIFEEEYGTPGDYTNGQAISKNTGA